MSAGSVYSIYDACPPNAVTYSATEYAFAALWDNISVMPLPFTYKPYSVSCVYT